MDLPSAAPEAAPEEAAERSADFTFGCSPELRGHRSRSRSQESLWRVQQGVSRLEGSVQELRSDLGNVLKAQTAELRRHFDAQAELLQQALRAAVPRPSAPARAARPPVLALSAAWVDEGSPSPARRGDDGDLSPSRLSVPRTTSDFRPGTAGSCASWASLPGGQSPSRLRQLGRADPPSNSPRRPPGAPPAQSAARAPAEPRARAERPPRSSGRGRGPEAGRASRRSQNAELFSPIFEHYWRACQVEISTALRFDAGAFFKTAMIEMLPYFISGPLLLVIKMCRAEKWANWSWPYRGVLAHSDLWAMCIFWPYFICSLLWDANIWDASFLLLLAMCRSITLAVKYALYGDKARESMQSAWYRKFDRVHVESMSTHILNITGAQCVSLLEKACLAQVQADCDLSTGRVRFVCEKDAKECLAVAARLVQQVVDYEIKMTGADAVGSPAPPLVSCKFECLTEEARGIMGRCLPALDKAEGDECEVSTFAYALYLVHKSHSTSRTEGSLLFWGASSVMGILLGFVAPVVRSLLGEPAFGSSIRASLLLCVHPLVYGYLSHVLLYFGWAPCLFRYRQYRLECRMLKSMMLPRDHQPVCVKWWRVTREEPRLDMTAPENVLGWAAVWRVLHGGSFNSAFQTRSNLYCMITFGAVLLGTTLQTVAYELSSNSSLLPGKVQSILLLGLLASMVCMQTWLAYYSNCLAEEYGVGLHSHRMNIAAYLQKEADDDREYELTTAFEFLDALEAEISAKANAQPVMVCFVRGDIIRLYTILIIFMSLLYVDGSGLRQMLDDRRQS